MSMSDIKRKARLALHKVHAEPCVYTDTDGVQWPSAEQSAEGLTLTARFHSKTKVLSPENDGVSILENIERLVFHDDQLTALGLTLDTGGTALFAGYNLNLELDQEMDPDGPLNVYWTIVRA